MLNKHDLCCHREDLPSEMTSCDSQSKANVAYDAYHPMKKRGYQACPPKLFPWRKCMHIILAPQDIRASQKKKQCSRSCRSKLNPMNKCRAVNAQKPLGWVHGKPCGGGWFGLSVIRCRWNNVWFGAEAVPDSSIHGLRLQAIYQQQPLTYMHTLAALGQQQPERMQGIF